MARAKKERAKYVAVIESLDQEGRGVARRDGKVVFIEGALPGEKVEYEVYRSKPSFELGLTTEIYKESPLRVLPKCPHFGVKDGSCGGCAMQHLEAHAQVAMKQKVLMDALWHIGRVRPEQVLAPIYGSAWRYRHRARAGAKDNNLADKTEFEARNLFDWTLDDWDAVWNKLGGVDRVLIDPPREGAMALCRSLADTDKRPARLVYVSCNPATLARDAALLVREGGWKLLSAGVMNMFPHTAHVESIAVFEPGPKPEKIDEIDEIEIGGMTEEAEQEARSEEPKI